MKKTIDTEHLKNLNPLKTLSWAAFDWTVIIFAFYLASALNNLFGYIFAVLVIGNRQHALGFIGHEGVHNLIFKNEKLNDLTAGIVALWPIATGVDSYRKFHNLHHKHLGTPKDPELRHKYNASPEFDLPLSPIKMLAITLKDLLGFSIPLLSRMSGDLRPRTKFDILGQSTVWLTAIFTLLYFDALWMLLVWVVSLGTSFWATFRIRIWIEHLGTLDTNRLNPSFIWRILFLPHNTGLHYEHHRWPKIPFWNLPQTVSLDTRPSATLPQLFDYYFNHAPKIMSGALPIDNSKSLEAFLDSNSTDKILADQKLN